MKRQMRKRKCRNCGEWFLPGPYNAHHQQYCGKDECCKVSKRASSRRYREKKKNDPEFKEKEKKRVLAWRERNPGYWKKGRRKKAGKKLVNDPALRDFAPAKYRDEMNALRDRICRQETCFKGFMAFVNGTLRDDIGSQMNHYYDIGKHFSDDAEKSWQQGDFAHVTERNHLSGAAETSAGGIRLDRSSPGA
jgi:hypothetical protein